MNTKEETEHRKLLRNWASGKLSRAGILRCMVLSKKAEREAEDAFAAKFAERHVATSPST